MDIADNGTGLKGECRSRRAGAILDVSTDGYYNSELCIKDFVKVVEQSQILYLNAPYTFEISFSGSFFYRLLKSPRLIIRIKPQ